MASGVAEASKAQSVKLDGLPTEILDLVFFYLSPADNKKLRLSSQILGDVAARYLFARVRVSLLKSDIEALRCISKHPQFSQIPKQLIWYEWNVLYLSDRTTAHNLSLATGALITEPSMIKTVNSHAHSLRSLSGCFWLDWVPRNATNGHQVFREMTKAILPFIQTALDAMPNIRSIISRPGPPDRLVGARGYQFTAGVVQNCDNTVGNLGLLILLEYLARSNHEIGSLYWADLAAVEPTCFYLQDHHKNAFTSLKRLDLCLVVSHGSDEVQRLALCLYAATNLEQLKIRFLNKRKRTYINDLIQPQDKEKSESSETPPDPDTWSKLSSLEIADAIFHENEMTAFLQRHANSLRHLSLQDCGLYTTRIDVEEFIVWGACWHEFLQGVVDEGGLPNLESITIRQRGCENCHLMVDVDALLRFLNKTGPSPFLPKRYYVLNTFRFTEGDDVESSGDGNYVPDCSSSASTSSTTNSTSK